MAGPLWRARRATPARPLGPAAADLLQRGAGATRSTERRHDEGRLVREGVRASTRAAEPVDGYGVLSYHHSMLADAARVDAFTRAIAATVQPGDVVVEIGTGTGVLAAAAVHAGARRVYAIERGPVIRLARLLRDANGLEHHVELVHGDSTAVELPERGDVLVTETLWNFGLGEGIGGAVLDARERLLAPGARIIPAALELLVAPVEHAEAHARVEFWSTTVGGLDLAAARPFAANNHHRAIVGEADLLCEPCTLARLDLHTIQDGEAGGTVTARVTRPGTVHGVAGWFRARLSPGVVLSNGPPLATPNWSHAFFPLEEPLAVRAGDELRVFLRSAGNGSTWAWRVDGPEGGVGTRGLGQSTLWGFPLEPDPAPRPADERPTASARGRAAAAVLRLADGRRTIGEIAGEVLVAHPDAFARGGGAEAFVRELVRGYC